MTRPTLRTITLLCLLLLPAVATAGPNMKPGLWEMTSTLEMPGLPMAMPPTNFSQCLTEDDLVPRTNDPSMDCQVTQSDTSGDTVSWTVTCRGGTGQVTTSSGSVTYRGDSFQGSMQVEMQGANMPGKMTQKMSGKRIGDCR